MVDQSDIEIVETTEDHYRFRFRDRERFDELTDRPNEHRRRPKLSLKARRFRWDAAR